MALALTVEDGSGVANANSYDTAANVIAYNLQRGIDMTGEDASDVIAWITQAMDFLETYEDRWQGDRALPLVQSLSWPRTDVVLFGQPWPTTGIPSKLQNALAYLTGLVFEGIDLYAVQTSRAITRETIGPITTEYNPLYGATVKPSIPVLDAMLKPLIKSGIGMLNIVRM